MSVERPTAPELTDPLVDESFYAGDPFPLYARLRDEAPVVWHQPPEGGGWWVVSTQPEVLEVSRDPGRFESGKGILTMEIGIDYPSPPTMMHTDPPVHTRYRKLVQPGFSPSRIRALEEPLRALVRRLLDELPTGEPVDIVPTLAEPYPVHVIADLLGIPDADRDRFVLWSDATIPGASNLSFEECMALMAEMQEYLMAAGRSRRGGDGTDLISVLANVEIDGETLTDDELLMFFNQLLVAGNETTRNMISGGLWALANEPEQMAKLVDDRSLIPACVEEWLRWTTPVVAFMRTATADTVVRGVPIAAGESVYLAYVSGNRDEEVFTDPFRFDVGREPNKHLAFGYGVHFCLGAALARMEMNSLFTELLSRLDSIELAGSPELSATTFVGGFKHLPIRYSLR